ncbi:MAG: M48 family metallopeptidase, partial [Planctomycetota bacterium]
LGSGYKLLQLAAGGSVVARSLGGRRLSADTTDPDERRVLNVVEEMAIASGVPNPPVYMMDRELGINAFAAGYKPGDAVIGVTRGCVQQLSRDELQGVMAHEFSHILNGDMRLNIRIMGILHGILLIGLIGYWILRSTYWSASSRRESKGNQLVFVGLGLMAVGFMGTFFGNLIKAAVSRQREFLADASAVQFTRNPDGIGGALMKIGGLKKGAAIDNPNAPEASHMFFGQAVVSGLSSMFATHPPIKERVKRILPHWDGRVSDVSATPTRDQTRSARYAQVSGMVSGMAEGAAPPPESPPTPAPEPVRYAGGAIESVGQLTDAHIAYATELVKQIPEPLYNSAHETYSARAVIYALLIDGDRAVRDKQLKRLDTHGDTGIRVMTEQLYGQAAGMDARLRLPLVDLALGALAELSESQYTPFMENVKALIEADAKVDLFEWSLSRVLTHHLSERFEGRGRDRVRYHGMGRLMSDVAALLSALAYVGHRKLEDAQAAYATGAGYVGLGHQILDGQLCGQAALNAALEKLDQGSPQVKKSVLTACAATIAADREVTVAEAELLRAIADSLSCPMPPLLPGQPLV